MPNVSKISVCAFLHPMGAPQCPDNHEYERVSTPGNDTTVFDYVHNAKLLKNGTLIVQNPQKAVYLLIRRSWDQYCEIWVLVDHICRELQSNKEPHKVNGQRVLSKEARAMLSYDNEGKYFTIRIGREEYSVDGPLAKPGKGDKIISPEALCQFLSRDIKFGDLEKKSWVCKNPPKNDTPPTNAEFDAVEQGQG